MALSEWERLFIYDTSSQILDYDLLTNYYLLGSSVGASLRDMVLQQQPVQSITQPYDEAITGTLRADAAAVGQNARNVGEAASMMGVGATAVSQISDALAEMEDIIDKINDGELDGSDSTVQADYNALRDKIVGLVESSDYNGIYMLDSDQWGTEQIDSNGQVYIQAYKDGGFNLTFYAMDDSVIDWTQLDGADLEDSTDRAAQLALVESYTSQSDTILDLYEGRQSSLEFQQTELENQADLLDQAAQARRQSTSSDLSVEDLLLNLLLGDSGKILDESS